jgi:hypothetical protein
MVNQPNYINQSGLSDQILLQDNDIESLQRNNYSTESNIYYEIFCNLTWSERLRGYMVCSCIGYFITFGSVIRINEALHGDPTLLAFFISLGNILSLTSSFFLSGPYKQWENMINEKRFIASTIYILSILSVLILIFIPAFNGKAVLIIVLLIIQFISWLWYTISYIPYARETIKACFL